MLNLNFDCAELIKNNKMKYEPSKARIDFINIRAEQVDAVYNKLISLLVELAKGNHLNKEGAAQCYIDNPQNYIKKDGNAILIEMPKSTYDRAKTQFKKTLFKIAGDMLKTTEDGNYIIEAPKAKAKATK